MNRIESDDDEGSCMQRLGDLTDDELRFLFLIRSSDRLFFRAKKLLLNGENDKSDFKK